MFAFRTCLVRGLPSTTFPTATYVIEHHEYASYHMKEATVGEKKNYTLTFDAFAVA